ncbi:hypothetical protein MHM_03140 [Candidatus Mycoplasma haemominutum 'Birmingham 1']|uniref:Uncharacterized protein n=2 Tax=Candidatus Mycoplasma haematominutum TaxID=209446 RepID=G8C3D4_9MOLU|nr:hypothetical protein MHM_03140 [Candidatus Mycoplasma haematominutum 'Birmingham 1']
MNKSLNSLNSDLDSLSTAGDGLISEESARLSAEKQQSERKFKALEASNSSTKEKAGARKNAGDQLQRASLDLAIQQSRQSVELSRKSNQLSAQLNNSTSSLKAELETKIQAYHSKLQAAVKQETEKLNTALKKLQDSNSQLIAEVKKNIEEMPYKLFEFEAPETKIPKT